MTRARLKVESINTTKMLCVSRNGERAARQEPSCANGNNGSGALLLPLILFSGPCLSVASYASHFREQNVAKMCETLLHFGNDLRTQIQVPSLPLRAGLAQPTQPVSLPKARLWEPHVMVGVWTLDLTWMVMATKEMVCHTALAS